MIEEDVLESNDDDDDDDNDDGLLDMTVEKGKSKRNSHNTSRNHFNQYLTLINHRKRTFEDLEEKDVNWNLVNKFSDYVTKHCKNVNAAGTHLGYISGIKNQLEDRFPEKITGSFMKSYNELTTIIIQKYTVGGTEGSGVVSNSKLPAKREIEQLFSYLIREKLYDFRAYVAITILIGGRSCEGMEIRFNKMKLFHEDLTKLVPNAFLIEVYRKKTNTLDDLCIVPNGEGNFEICGYHAIATFYATRTNIDNKCLNKSNKDINVKIKNAGLTFNSHIFRSLAINILSNAEIPKEWSDLRVGNGTSHLRSSPTKDVACAIVLAGGYAVKKGVGNCPDIDCIPLMHHELFKRFTCDLFSTVTGNVPLKILYMLSCILVMYHTSYKDKYGNDDLVVKMERLAGLPNLELWRVIVKKKFDLMNQTFQVPEYVGDANMQSVYSVLKDFSHGVNVMNEQLHHLIQRNESQQAFNHEVVKELKIINVHLEKIIAKQEEVLNNTVSGVQCHSNGFHRNMNEYQVSIPNSTFATVEPEDDDDDDDDDGAINPNNNILLHTNNQKCMSKELSLTNLQALFYNWYVDGYNGISPLYEFNCTDNRQDRAVLKKFSRVIIILRLFIPDCKYDILTRKPCKIANFAAYEGWKNEIVEVSRSCQTNLIKFLLINLDDLGIDADKKPKKPEVTLQKGTLSSIQKLIQSITFEKFAEKGCILAPDNLTPRSNRSLYYGDALSTINE